MLTSATPSRSRRGVERGRSPKGLPYPERHRGGITGQQTGEPGTGNQGEPYRGARNIQTTGRVNYHTRFPCRATETLESSDKRGAGLQSVAQRPPYPYQAGPTQQQKGPRWSDIPQGQDKSSPPPKTHWAGGLAQVHTWASNPVTRAGAINQD